MSTLEKLKGTSKNSGLVIRRGILIQVKMQNMQEYFVYFKYFA